MKIKNTRQCGHYTFTGDIQHRCCIALTAPRNADVPVHMHEGRGTVTIEFVPNEVGELTVTSHIAYAR